MSLDIERARFNMVEQQVRTWHVLDARALDALRTVRREDFVPARYRAMAFADVAIPLEHGEWMMKPVQEGRALQALAVHAEDSVLEIGTGSGFLTACLAQLGREVVSVDIHADFVAQARARLEQGGYANTRLEVGDAMNGYDPHRQFDVVCITGAVYRLPEHFTAWLKPGGRLFVVRGEAPAMEAVLITRQGEHCTEQSLFETELTYLVNAAPPKQFVL